MNQPHTEEAANCPASPKLFVAAVRGRSPQRMEITCVSGGYVPRKLTWELLFEGQDRFYVFNVVSIKASQQ
jgi:hypothetical protein